MLANLLLVITELRLINLGARQAKLITRRELRIGFQHQSDIEAITVNRIPHGYAYPYVKLDDPEWETDQAPHEVGRAQFGRISIANSDSEAVALMNSAFDAAYRAVEEQTG